MFIHALQAVLDRDLKALIKEISLYNDEARIWHTEKSIANSAGNLCLHLVGNLNGFVGAVLGHTGYVRNRDSEFNSKNISRQQLIKGIEEVIVVVNNTFSHLTDDDLAKDYPQPVFNQTMTTAHFLTHILAHFNYHLGQINYHRRLLDTVD